MQPYIFPYIGYFQLINAVDKFIVYDDVNYIKQGWINRNRILVNGIPHTFTVPIENSSSFKTIKSTRIHKVNYISWKEKQFKTLELSYKHSPHFNDVMPLIVSIFNQEYEFISDFASGSVTGVCTYLKIDTLFVKTSSIYQNNELHGQERVLDICKKENALQYINSSGGENIYSKEAFREQGVELSFIKAKLTEYQQFTNLFLPGLSIIDVLMFNDKSQITKHLGDFELF